MENKILALILNYNSSFDTVRLYNELEYFYPNIGRIIIDNNSSIIDKKYLKKNINSTDLMFNYSNFGYAGGNNVGIKRAIKEGAKYIWILNPDIKITKNSLPILIDTIKNDHTIAAVGPRICYRNKPTTIYSDGGIIIQEKGFFTTHKNSNKQISSVSILEKENLVDYVNGSAMLIQVETFKHIGAFREDFFLYFEETEWCLRASKQNYKLIVNTDAVVYHASSEKSSLYHFYMTRNRIWLAKIQNRYVFKTIKEVVKTVFLQFIKEFKKGKISLNTKARIKGVVAGVFRTLKK